MYTLGCFYFRDIIFCLITTFIYAYIGRAFENVINYGCNWHSEYFNLKWFPISLEE